MKTKIFLLVILIANSLLFGQDQLQSLIDQGVSQSYNMDFTAAEKTFNTVIKLKPSSPLGYYHLAQLNFWIYLGSHKEAEYKNFLKSADIAQEKIDKTLAKKPKSIQTKYIAGNLSLFRAMAQSTNNSSVDAFWSSKKAVSYLNEVIEQNPKYYDAYLGLGLFDYAMSFVPDFLKWAVNLTGLSSDKARGFNYIKLAYKKGTTTKTEASFHLSKIYTDYLAEFDSAFIHLKNLNAQYPNNTLFYYQYAVSLIKARQLDQALVVLNKVIKLNNKKLPQITAYAQFRKGEIYFKKNQFKLAIASYQKFLELSKEIDFKGWAALHTAYCYRFLGDTEKFKKNLTLAKNGNHDIFEDSYALRKSERFLGNGISPTELKLVRMKNYLDAGRYNIVFDSLKSVMDKIENKEDRAVAYTYFCEAALNLRKYSSAVYSADQVSALDLSSENWTKAMSLVLKAKAKYLTHDRKSAKQLLKNAEDKNEYEFKDYIQSQIEWLKRRLKG